MERGNFLELLDSFVDHGWVDEIDRENIERIDKSFILQDFAGKEKRTSSTG
ncbi:MAG TPA: hypothetical protein VIM29_08975 [Bacillota bacterium]